MSTEQDQERAELGRDAAVHALLHEELGTNFVDDDATARAIAARFASGGAGAAAERVRAAGRSRGWAAGVAARWPLLCAAAAVLAVAAVLVDSRGDDAGGDPDPVTAQDPVPVPDQATFLKLMARVRTLHVEALMLPDTRLPGVIEIAGQPIIAADHLVETFVDEVPKGLITDQPAAADWQNRFTFVLDDGTFVRGALYPYGNKRKARLHLSGLKGDLLLGTGASDVLHELLDAATQVACIAQGIVRSVEDLRTFPDSHEELRLFLVPDEALTLLERYDDLRKLDVSGLRKSLGTTGLRTIGRTCAGLRELRLDHCTVEDDDLRWLTNLVELRVLSLRSVEGGFTGAGFRAFSLSQRALAGPTTIDVGYVKTIDDDGLRAICELDPEVLGLRNTGKAISRRGFRALEDTERLRELDLRGFAWNDKGMIPTINALRKRAGLTIRRDE